MGFALVDEASLAVHVPDGLEPQIGPVRNLAQRFKITPLAMATRLRSSGYFTWPQYNAWKAGWNNFVTGIVPKTGGFATPVSRTLGRAGRGFSQLVLGAYDTNRITTAEAAHFLNLRTDQFDALRQRLSAGALAGSSDE